MISPVLKSVLGSVVVFAGVLAAQTPGKVDFRRDIRPIFQEHCVGCHGPDQQMSGMRLDRRSSAMGIRGGTTIGPGNAEGSRLYLKLISTKYGSRMPPTGPLSAEQIGLIKAWIDQGAEWPDDLSGDKAPTLPDPRASRIMEALRDGDRLAFARLLREDANAVNLKGPGGSTPLMYAALYGDLASMSELIGRGADTATSNDAGATAMMWAVDDLDKARLLLEHGADPNAVSTDTRTPLAIALDNRGPVGVVKLLLDHGAKVDGPGYRGRSPLAGAGGDEAVLRTIIGHGVEVTRLSAALPSALATCAACIDLLIPSVPKSALSSGLITAAGDRDGKRFYRPSQPRCGREDRGPGLGIYLPDVCGGFGIRRGGPCKDTDRTRSRRECADGGRSYCTGLRIAVGQPAGCRTVTKGRRETGNRSPPPVLKPKPAASARAAVERSIPLLQRSDVAFLKKSGCVSCHNNTLTAMTVAAARKQGIAVDDTVARTQVQTIAAYVDGARERYLQGISIAGGVDTTGYILLGMAAESWPSDPTTDAMVRYLKSRQREDGSWRTLGGRPPIESSDIETTAAAIRAIRVYMPRPQHAEYEKERPTRGRLDREGAARNH